MAEIGKHPKVSWKMEGKGLAGRPRRRWEDNIGMDLTEIYNHL
jgi:hypothetical protein